MLSFTSIRDEVLKISVTVSKIYTNFNLVDVLTKAIPIVKFKFCVDLIGVMAYSFNSNLVMCLKVFKATFVVNDQLTRSARWRMWRRSAISFRDLIEIKGYYYGLNEIKLKLGVIFAKLFRMSLFQFQDFISENRIDSWWSIWCDVSFIMQF